MKKFNEFKINESNIGDDTKELAEDLVSKGIAPFTQSTGRGSKGKLIIKLATGGKSYDELKKDIENNYRKMNISTSLSSNYYYSPLHKLYFYFYKNDRVDKSFKPKIDKMITWDYYILTLRKIPKSNSVYNSPHPKSKLYQSLLDTITQREDQLRKMSKNDPDRKALENELKVAKDKLKNIKSKYKFEKLFTFNDFSSI